MHTTSRLLLTYVLYNADSNAVSRPPESSGIGTVQCTVLDLKVCHMIIDQSSLKSFAQHQSRRKHPPSAFIPEPWSPPDSNLRFKQTKQLLEWEKLNDLLHNNLHDKIPGLGGMLFTWWGLSLKMNKSTKKGNYLTKFVEAQISLRIPISWFWCHIVWI